MNPFAWRGGPNNRAILRGGVLYAGPEPQCRYCGAHVGEQHAWNKVPGDVCRVTREIPEDPCGGMGWLCQNSEHHNGADLGCRVPRLRCYTREKCGVCNPDGVAAPDLASTLAENTR